MTKELIVAIEIARSDLSKAISAQSRELAGIKVHNWTGSLGEKGSLAVKTVPDIIILDDSPDAGNVLARIKTIQGNFPLVALFVVSENKDPQQIIDVMKAGAAEYLVEPVPAKILHNAIEEVRARLANEGKLAQGSVYSFISSKGGVGATVLAVNIAASLAMGKKSSVAMIDMCFQSGDASVLLDIDPKTTVLDICENIHRLDVSFLRGAMSGHTTGMNFLAAPRNPEDSEEITNEHVHEFLQLSRKLYDHVILDCTSMHINDCSIEAFNQSDKVFVITDMSVPSIRNTVRLYKLIKKVGISPDRIEIIINRFIKGGVLSLAEIEKNFEKPVYWLVPNDFSDIISSINRGIPLVKLNPGAPFTKNIKQLIKKIQSKQDDPEFRGIRGTFGKML